MAGWFSGRKAQFQREGAHAVWRHAWREQRFARLAAWSVLGLSAAAATVAWPRATSSEPFGAAPTVATLNSAVALAAPQDAAPSRSSASLEPPLFEGYEADGYPAISAPSEIRALAFVEPGIVAEVPVVETQTVKTGDVLVRLDDRVQSLNVEGQRIAAEDDSQLRAAQRRLDLAIYDLEKVKVLEAEDAGVPRELERAEAEKALRDIDLTAATRNRQQARIAYEREQKILADMALRSPIDGQVARVEVDPGEAVEALKPVVHLVAVDPLWMDVAVPIQLGLFVEPGHVAVARWRDVPSPAPMEGRVLWVSAVADAADNSIVVRLELDNAEQLPAGLHAYVQFPEAEEALRRSMER